MESTEKLLQQLRDSLKAIFNSVPLISHVEMAIEPAPIGSAQVDLIAKLTTSNSQLHQLAVEFKSQGHPRQLRDAITQVLRFKHHNIVGEIIPVVAAPHIGPEGAALCRQEKINYCDIAGNCLLNFGGIFIERTGQPNRLPRTPSATPDIYAPKSERVLRILLQDPLNSWKVVPLAAAANVSVGTVSTVRKLLLDHEWAKETETGITLTRPEKLLKDWAITWARRRTRIQGFITLDGVNQVETRLASYAAGTNHALALTGAAAAWRHAQMVRYQRVQAYWAGNVTELAAATGLKPADAGANVQIITPRDDGVFYGATNYSGVSVVSAVQTYLDLQREPARGAEAAQFLWDTILFPIHGTKQ